MSRFIVTDMPLAGLKCVQRQRLGDSRGFLTRLFCTEELAQAGWGKPISQINHTYTQKQGTVRGLHYQQTPHAEMKLVTCLRGAIWDVAIDLRAGSPTFLHWHAVSLSADNGKALLIPEGFAHGFQAQTADVELVYCHSASYQAGAEAGLNPLDARLDIAWPLAITEMSDRDRNHPFLKGFFAGVIP